ncbi:MAG TPA: ABC transporter permease [Clostridia bacterium]|nr:ABC transporter permease [Clostridia bacterium]
MVKRLWKFLQGTYLGIMLLFLYAPIFFLIIYSFNSSKTLGNWTGFTFDWYVKLVTNSTIIDAIWVTVSVAVISSIAATVLGTAAAIGIQSMKKRRRSLILGVSQLPMVNPDLVTGVSLMLLFMFVGLRNGYVRLLIAHITFNIPYVLFSVLPRLRQSSDMLYEAALDLGCTPMQALWKVVIPDISPGIISGFILAFTLSIDDFVISFFAGNGVDNLSMYIFSSARQGVNPALSTIIFIPVLTLLLIVNIRSIRKEREDEIQNKKTKIKTR